jgi:peptidoglycan/LPS O-acetylase OafA/YrhL
VQYRPDIDGLRGLAILSVVLFHVGFPSFAGGFVGVDVFFVISGFLITSLIHPQMRAGGFSFAAFYERRIRRLFPALFAVVAACLILATLLLPIDLRFFSLSIAATVLFAANFLFWATTGYFDSSADSKLLLHAWTLSVEEQFYILFPAFLLLTLRYLPRHAQGLILALAVLSIAASATVAGSDPAAAFFLPFFRAWELLLGALLAMNAIPPVASPVLRDSFSLLGMFFVGYAVFTYTEGTALSGVHALLPCIGTALLIHTGRDGKSRMARILALRPLQFVGLISYSLYLWHWPLVVFAKYFANQDLNLTEQLLVLAASFVAATASWRYVERPFRGKNGLLSRVTLFRTAGALTAAFIAIGLAGHYSGGLPSRFPRKDADQPRVLMYQHCMNREPSRIAGGEACVLGAKSGAAPTFILWGDSHAGALAPAIERAATRAGRTGILAGQAGCLPLLGVERHDRRDLPCREFNEAVAKLLERYPDVRTVVLAGGWALYAEGSRFRETTGAPVLISRNGVDDNARAFYAGMEQTLRFLAERNLNVAFVTQAPEIGWDVPSVLARSQAYDRQPPAPPSFDDYRARQKKVTDIMTEISQRHSMRVVDIARILCPGKTCLTVRDGQWLYIDSSHLSTRGAEYVARAFAGVL